MNEQKIIKRYLNQQVLRYDFENRRTLWCMTVEFTDGTTGIVNEWHDMGEAVYYDYAPLDKNAKAML